MNTVNIRRIRFWCRTHNCPLINCGSGRSVSGLDEMQRRMDEQGWLELDTAELICRHQHEQFMTLSNEKAERLMDEYDCVPVIEAEVD